MRRDWPIRLTVDARDLPREVHDRAQFMLCAALAEAGVPDAGARWNGRQYEFTRDVPDDLLLRAQRIVLDALGIEYVETEAVDA